jgi:hypothetical protein
VLADSDVIAEKLLVKGELETVALDESKADEPVES